jgi:hypothetical protein
MRCDVTSFRDVMSCQRPVLVAHYAQAERQCRVRAPAWDLFQFGVPSFMTALIAGLARSGRDNYTTFWGFDSFVGLPNEDPVALLPSPGIWQPGQFSAGHELSGGYRTKTDALTGAEVYVPRSSASRPLTPSEARLAMLHRLGGQSRRIELVEGFYNVSLTRELAKRARPAMYVDINCDLFVSTVGALEWLLSNDLLVRGSLVGYDDCEPAETWFSSNTYRSFPSPAKQPAISSLAGDRV